MSTTRQPDPVDIALDRLRAAVTRARTRSQTITDYSTRTHTAVDVEDLQLVLDDHDARVALEHRSAS